jgi:hypothetical protein
MKLHEYLKQFEGLDPDAEVFCCSEEEGELIPQTKQHYVAELYMSSVSEDDREWFANPHNEYQRKVIVV